MGISRRTIADLAALVGDVVFDNATMDQLLYRHGFDPATAPVTIKKKANHLVLGIASSAELTDTEREARLVEIATTVLRQPRGRSTSEILGSR